MLTTGLMMSWETCSSLALAKIQWMLKTFTKKPILIKYVRQLFSLFSLRDQTFDNPNENYVKDHCKPEAHKVIPNQNASMISCNH